MAEETQDGSEVLETTETESGAGEPGEASEDSVQLSAQELADLKAKAAKADELEEKNKQLFERAKKAENKSSSKDDGLFNKDVLYLAKADVHPDDLDDVLEYARLKKIRVADAHRFMQPILKERAEERTTAAATQTRSPRGTSQVTGGALLDKARKGEDVPVEKVDDLAAARMERLKALRK